MNEVTELFAPIDRVFLHILKQDEQINHIRLVIKYDKKN